MRDLCIRHEMENPHEKGCLLSPKAHELFGQLYKNITVIILHVEGVGRLGDGAW